MACQAMREVQPGRVQHCSLAAILRPQARRLAAARARSPVPPSGMTRVQPPDRGPITQGFPCADLVYILDYHVTARSGGEHRARWSADVSFGSTVRDRP